MRITILIRIMLCSLLLIAGCSKLNTDIPMQENTPAPATDSVTPTPAEPQVPPEKLLLEKLTIEQKIGQLLIAGLPNGTKPAQVKEYIDTFKPGGFILYPRNYKSIEELHNLTVAMREYNKDNPLPLFISTDEEGGTVSRLPSGATKFPDMRKVGIVNDLELTQKIGEVIGSELQLFGINMNFAPVLDIVANKDSFLYKRSFGSDPVTVFRHSIAFIRGLNKKEIIAVGKHFPGHGDTIVDSHGKLPVISIDKTTLINRELAPYKFSFEAGLDAVMAGHLAFPRIDPSGLPASMSKVILTDILRDELGFEGLVIMDDIEMYGFLGQGKSFESSVIEAFNAGVDVFLICHTRKVQDMVLNALKSGLADGRISHQRLDEAVIRVIKLKLKYNLTGDVKHSLKEATQQLGNRENKLILEILNSRIK